MVVLAWAGILLTSETGRIASVWLANAAVLAIVLRSPRAEWLPLLATAFIANLTANMICGDSAAIAIGLSACNMLEVLLAAAITSRGLAPDSPFDDLRLIARFVLASVAASLLSATAAGLFLAITGSAPALGAFLHWAIADSLGLLTLTPLLLSMTGRATVRRRRSGQPETVLIILVVAGFAALLFSSPSAKLFTIAPLFLLAGYRLRVRWAAFLVAVVAIEATAFTLAGLGPIGGAPSSPGMRMFVLQGFIAAAALITLLVSAMSSERDRLGDALAESEARHRLLSDNSNDIIASVGSDGLLRSVSRASQRVLGYRPEDILGGPASFGIHADDLEIVRQAFARALADTDESVCYRQRRSDGRYVWLEAVYRLIVNPETGDREIIASIRDIDRRRRAEAMAERSAAKLKDANRQLTLARDEAQSATRAKSEFLATMSHEIRTPMTGVLGMIELLLGDPPKKERLHFLSTLKQSADLLMAVLNDVLDFSKIESGKLELSEQHFDFRQLTQSTLDLFQNAASRKGLLISMAFEAEGSPLVRGDSVRLQQVMSNLIGNAIKFTHTGRIDIRASGVARGADEQVWRVEVSDSGVGIADTDIDALFDPFVQADVSTARNFGGTGLGLAISRKLVSAMGGTIGAHSTPGGGSTFWFELTMPVGSRDRLANRASLIEAAPSRPMTILVAEDNPVNQMLIVTLLRRFGHGATCVGDGQLAVQAAERDAYDCILMDMQMPVLDGIAATRAIRASGGPNAAVPIFALTADASPERRRFCIQAGLDDLFTKPIDVPALQAKLAEISGEGLRRPRHPRVSGVTIASLPNGAALSAQHHHRKAALLDLLSKILEDACDAEMATDVRSELAVSAHQLAGTAALFGEAALGEAAAVVDEAFARPCSDGALPVAELTALRHSLQEATQMESAAIPPRTGKL
jgi:PAS domain S-box-containing protein